MEAVKALLQPANPTLDTGATLNTEIHKDSVRIKAPILCMQITFQVEVDYVKSIKMSPPF